MWRTWGWMRPPACVMSASTWSSASLRSFHTLLPSPDKMALPGLLS